MMSESAEHQKLQALRRKAYEVIEVHYAHLKQVIISDETLEQTKAAMKKFNTNKRIRAAGFQFNPGLQRWLHIARDRILVWERNHPKPKPEPKPKPKTKPKKPKSTKPKKEPEKEPDKEPESKPEEGAVEPQAGEETVETTAEPETETEEEPKPQ